MNCPNCKRPLATEDDFENIPEGQGKHLCWDSWGDHQCKIISNQIRKSAMTTIEILQAAIDEGCDIDIEATPHGTIHVYFCSPINAGWEAADTLETAVTSAWQHYQTNKNQ